MTQPAVSVLMSARDGAPSVREAVQERARFRRWGCLLGTVVHSSVQMRRVSSARDGERRPAEALVRWRAVRSGFARPLVARPMPPAGLAR